jgi:anti-sigma factor RsiW
MTTSGDPDEFGPDELLVLIRDYLDGALPADEHGRFERHLAVCPDCSHYVDQLRITIRLVGTLEQEHVAPEVRQRLLLAFHDWKRA